LIRYPLSDIHALKRTIHAVDHGVFAPSLNVWVGLGFFPAIFIEGVQTQSVSDVDDLRRPMGGISTSCKMKACRHAERGSVSNAAPDTPAVAMR